MYNHRVLPIYFIFMGYNILQMCWCAGSFEIRLIALSQSASGKFSPELRFCLKHFERRINHNGLCTFGEVTLDTERPRNGTKIEFDFAWPESFTLITEAWQNNLSTKELIFHDGFQREGIPSSNTWHEENLQVADKFRITIAYRVVCANDYYGKRCDIFCQPISTTFGHFKCLPNGTLACSSGWEGRNCDTASARCDNCVNGICDKPGSCRCKSGWTGPNCDQCMRYPGCKHGTCKSPNQCICDEGWGGHFCSEDLNYCTRHRPCKNGAICRNTGHGQYTCECVDGFTGTNCETLTQDCSSKPCFNGAKCLDLPGNNYTCICPNGYSGRHCQIMANSCADNPCQNGATCVPDSSISGFGFRCICPPGWTETVCDTQQRPCDGIECFNGGKCVEISSSGSYECVCPLGFAGKNCETNSNECVLFNPCMNGGRCIDEVNNYKCQCVEGFTGTLCQDHVVGCSSETCMNGARCIDVPGRGHHCQCKNGFRGTRCEFADASCNLEPCRNGGTCVESLQGFHCLCAPCFFGDDCSIRDSHCKVVTNQSEVFYSRIRANSDQKVRNTSSNLRTAVIFVLPACCLIFAIISAAAAILGRKRFGRLSSGNNATQNWRAFSKCCERRPCLNLRAQNTYCEHYHSCNNNRCENSKNLRQIRANDLDCSVRYAAEPALSIKSPPVPATQYPAGSGKHQHADDILIAPATASSSPDTEDYYEEIDNDLRRSDDDTDSGIVNPYVVPASHRTRRRSRDGREIADHHQTIL